MQLEFINSHEVFGGTRPGLPLVRLITTDCEALISLWGAQLLSFKSTGTDLSKEWLWLSNSARFSEGQAIRGGIPICLPWFGENLRNPDLTSHGFARNRLWKLESSTELDEGPDAGPDAENGQLVFVYNSTSTDLQYFSHRFIATLTMTLGEALRLELEIANLETVGMPFTFAFHSYFATNSLHESRVTGLDSYRFLDNNRELKSFVQDGDIVFGDAMDRVYQGHSDLNTTQQLDTGDRVVSVSAEYCPTVIVWNPGREQAARTPDIGTSQYHNFICLERGIAFDDEIQIDAGASFRATMSISSAYC